MSSKGMRQLINLLEATDVLTEAPIHRYDDVNALRQLERRSNAGWLLPDGNLLICSIYDHLDAVANSGYFPELKTVLADFEQYEENERDDFEASLDPDEHPGWHSFEYHMSKEKDQLRAVMLEYIYRQGWGRLGTYQKSRVKFLELETKEQSVPNLKEYAHFIADVTDRNLKITTVPDLNINYSVLPLLVKDWANDWLSP